MLCASPGGAVLPHPALPCLVIITAKSCLVGQPALAPARLHVETSNKTVLAASWDLHQQNATLFVFKVWCLPSAAGSAARGEAATRHQTVPTACWGKPNTVGEAVGSLWDGAGARPSQEHPGGGCLLYRKLKGPVVSRHKVVSYHFFPV